MEAKIKAMLAQKTSTASMIKNRASFIMTLRRKLGSQAEDMSFLNDKIGVMKIIRSYDNQTSHRTYLMHIIKMIDADTDKVVPKVNKDFYGRMGQKLKVVVQDIADDNVMSEKQRERYVSLNTLKLSLDSYMRELFTKFSLPLDMVSDENFNRLNTTRDRENIYSFMKSFQDVVFLGCYVLMPALRNNWAGLTITRRAIGLSNDRNWLVLTKNKKDKSIFNMKLILNQFKTAKHMGQQTIHITNDRLTAIINVWIALLERVINKPTRFLLYSIVAKSHKIEYLDKPDTASRQLIRVSKRIIGHEMSINDFRHIHESELQNSEEYKRMTVGQRKVKHNEMLHGYETAQRYAVQRRDENTDSNEA